jgi:predicted Rossmann fold flavoprotein
MEKSHYHLICVGAGAAGYFGAINFAIAAQQKFSNPARTLILESSNKTLSKVRISGGGRCNITNREEEPRELIKNYPRGGKNLLNAFYSFGPMQMKLWLEENGMDLKTEDDGRVFPKSNSSQSVIDLFNKLADKNQVTLAMGSKIQSIEPPSETEENWKITTQNETLLTKNILMATGSSKSGHSLAKILGHKITSLAPSLFSFKLDPCLFSKLPGVSKQDVLLKMNLGKKKLSQRGPLLITHWGISGPAVIKLSAQGAREFFEGKYQSELKIDWLPDQNEETLYQEFKSLQKSQPKKNIENISFHEIPKRLWHAFLISLEILEKPISEIKDKQLRHLANLLKQQSVNVKGKGEFKEEFVTCGGINLKEIDMNTFESKIHSSLYFAGEMIDVDALTGGFNFQNAWTGSYLASQNMIDKLDSL